jgi:hypothetical protein
MVPTPVPTFSSAVVSNSPSAGEAVRPSRPPSVPPLSGAENFTQLLRKVEAPHASSWPSVSTPSLAASATIAPEEKFATPPISGAPAGSGDLSFTDMYQREHSSADTVAVTPIRPVAQNRDIPISGGPLGGESFTQSYKTMNEAPATVEPPPSAIERSVVAPVRALDNDLDLLLNPVAPAGPEPMDTILQLLQSIDSPATPVDPRITMPVFSTPPTASAAPFAPSAQSFEAGVRSPVLRPPPSSGPGESGSFTQLFQVLESPSRLSDPPQHTSKPAVAAQQGLSGDGGFTQLFRGASQQPHQPQSQADAFPPIHPAAGGMGYAANGGAMEFGGAAPRYVEPRLRMPEAAPSNASPETGGEGLTRMLEVLGSSSDASMNAKAVPPVSYNAPEGSLTRTLDAMEGRGGATELSAPARFGKTAVMSSQTRAVFSGPSPVGGTPSVPVTPAGPSEYTRIITASAMREGGAQGGRPLGQPAPAPVQAPPAQGFQGQIPYIPTPQKPHIGGGGGAYQPPQMPNSPQLQLPQMTSPMSGGPAQNGSKMVQYMPILTIIVIVLLVGIVLLLMLKR